jgi:hypothetical protein
MHVDLDNNGIATGFSTCRSNRANNTREEDRTRERSFAAALDNSRLIVAFATRSGSHHWALGRVFLNVVLLSFIERWVQLTTTGSLKKRIAISHPWSILV